MAVVALDSGRLAEFLDLGFRKNLAARQHKVSVIKGLRNAWHHQGRLARPTAPVSLLLTRPSANSSQDNSELNLRDSVAYD